MGRRGRRGPPLPADRGGRAARRAVGTPVGGRDRPRGVRRLRPRGRLRAAADRADDERVARAGERRVVRRPPGRHRERAVPGDEPVVVDRRPPSAVPVRHRGRARDPRRRARAALSQPLLRRGDPGVLGLDGRGVLGVGVASVELHELRQGRARTGHGGQSRHGARPLPRRAGGCGVSTDPLDLADRALAFTDGDAQVTVTRERSLLSRFARSTPTQATAVDDTSVSVLVVRDGHVGTVETNDLSDDGLRAAAARARDAARAAADAAGGHGEHPGLPTVAQAGTPSAHAGFDAATADLDPAPGGAALAAAFAATAEHGLEAFGIWTTGRVETAIASSAGLRVADDVTDAYLKVIARDAHGRSGWGAAAGVAAGTLDADAVARQAVARVATTDPVALAPGEYEVVLEPDAVGSLLDMLGGLAFDGLAHAEGRGALTDRLGTPVAATGVTLVDDPLAAGGLPRAFDADGVAKAPLTLLRDGVAQAVAHDRRSAARAGGDAASTGHALAPGGSPWGAAPTNLVLHGGTAPDVGALIAGVERGLYVTRLWYLNVVHERSTTLTGTTRDGTFLIEDGRLTKPVRDVRFTDAALGILERTSALTTATSLVCEADFYGRRAAHGCVVPALRASGFRVTGQTTG
ncbi:hypothetical protein GKE82_06470 [Conexibacter sp. W3-3-2]|nr:hypothetical protein [Conexibacter sp. W3-3-2]